MAAQELGEIMKPYLLDLFVASAKAHTRTPDWIIRLYLSIFEPPLGKTLRLDLVNALLRQYGCDLRGKRVLDVGCGIGDLGFILAERGAHVIGVELDPRKVEYANKIALKWSFPEERLRFIAGDVCELEQMGLGQFDAVFCLALLEHVEDDMGLLRQIHHLLHPDGFLMLEVPSATRRTIPEVEAEDGHVRPGYSFKEMPGLLARAGFCLNATQTIDPLGLKYHWLAFSRVFPGRTARGQLFAILAPLFIPLIRLTSVIVKRPEAGAELCFIAIKEEESSKFPFAPSVGRGVAEVTRTE
jgi:2-polyprenyl-6-hydroxyphenyl methylase/3-demethylubiquinone-9 3-methyltransferase